MPCRPEAGCIGISVASPLARPGGRGAARTPGRSAWVPCLDPSQAGERTLGTAGPSFLEESPEICRGSEALLGLPGTVGGWATLATKHAFREHLPLLPLGRGAHCDSVHTILFFFFFSSSSEEQVASGTLEKQPLWEEGRGRGQGAHKASAQEPQESVPWEEWRLSPPVRVFFSCLFFLF